MAEPICSMVPLRKSPPIRVARDRKSTRLNPVTVNLVCRLLLEKKKKKKNRKMNHDIKTHVKRSMIEELSSSRNIYDSPLGDTHHSPAASSNCTRAIYFQAKSIH